MKRILLTVAVFSLAAVSRAEQLPKKEAPAEPAANAEEKVSFSKLYASEPGKAARLPAYIFGNWVGDVMGTSIEFQFRKTEKGFAGLLKFVDEDSPPTVGPFIGRQVTGDGVKFMVPMDLDFGDWSVELALDGKTLRGHIQFKGDESGEKMEVILERREGVAVAGEGTAKLEGKWRGSFEGVAPVNLSLKENEKGFEGVFSMALRALVDHVEMELPLSKTQREGEEIKFVVSNESGDGWSYHLVIEGDVLTGYQIGGRGGPDSRVWVAFERIGSPKKPDGEK
jgi:hypothetical protein